MIAKITSGLYKHFIGFRVLEDLLQLHLWFFNLTF